MEYLCTHAPSSTQTGDSFTRQIRTKLPLLTRRFEAPMDFSKYFDLTDQIKIWEKLYSYRSAIAHGGTFQLMDLCKKVFQTEIKAKRGVLDFLQLFTKRLLKTAIAEPILVEDLKKC